MSLTYVIGDLHGNLNEFLNILKYIDDGDKFIFLGDYIDKGIYVKETINKLLDISNNKKCIFLMGNHEYALYKYSLNKEPKWIDFLKLYGGKSTIKSYLGTNKVTDKSIQSTIREMKNENHWGFIENLKLYYETKDYYMMHAGYDIRYLKIKDVLSNNLESLLFARWEFINSKKFLDNKKIIFGHTVFEEPYIDNYKIGLDTGAGYNGKLSALCIEKGFIINSVGNSVIINNR